MKPELLKLMSLEGNKERQRAYQAAQQIRNANDLFRHLAQAKEDSPQYRQLLEWWESTWCIFGLDVSMSENPSEFLELVVKALDGKPSRFDLTQTGEKVIRAWHAAQHLAGRSENGWDPFVKPTLRQVKEEFVRLFIKEERPADLTSSQWLQELKDRGEIPSDYSIRKILDRLKLPWRKDKPGPRGPWRYGARQKKSATKFRRLVA